MSRLNSKKFHYFSLDKLKRTGPGKNHRKIGDFILASHYDHMMYVHRLELQKFFNFCAAHSPVRLDIETRFLISNY